MQNSERWLEIGRKYGILQATTEKATTEPHNQHQNPAERRIQTVKNGVNRLMDRTSTPKFLWFECLVFFCAILNFAASPTLNGQYSIQVALGHSTDISPYIVHEWLEPVYYLEYEDPLFPNSREKLGYFCDPVENCGDLLTFKLYVPESHQLIYRSVIRSAIDDKDSPNLRAANPHYPGIKDNDDDHMHDYMFDRTAIDELLSTRVADDAADIPFEIPSEKNSVNATDDLTSLAEVIAKIHEQEQFKKYGVIPDPADLIGFTFPIEHEGITQQAKVKELQPDKHKAVIELMDGSHSLIDYHLLLETFNMPSEDRIQIFTFTGFSDHKKIKGVWHLLVNWEGVGYEPSWESLTNMKEADPITCALYAREHNLINQKGWKWAKKIRVDARKLIRIAKRIYSAKRTSDLFKFGIQVPQSVDEALAIDKANGNTLWKDAIEKELGQILEYETFKILPHGERAPTDHKRVLLHLVFDVKHDGRRKACLVAVGHVTDPGNEEVYSSVVAPEGARLVMFLADYNGLDIMCGDVGNAFLNGVTQEKIWCIAGPEFGPKIAGRVLIIVIWIENKRCSMARSVCGFITKRWLENVQGRK